MNKKIITLVLIFLIIINTIFWLNVTIKTYESRKTTAISGGRIDWEKVIKKKGTLSKEEQEEARERQEKARAKANTITYRMIKIIPL